MNFARGLAKGGPGDDHHAESSSRCGGKLTWSTREYNNPHCQNLLFEQPVHPVFGRYAMLRGRADGTRWGSAPGRRRLYHRYYIILLLRGRFPTVHAGVVLSLSFAYPRFPPGHFVRRPLAVHARGGTHGLQLVRKTPHRCFHGDGTRFSPSRRLSARPCVYSHDPARLSRYGTAAGFVAWHSAKGASRNRASGLKPPPPKTGLKKNQVLEYFHANLFFYNRPVSTFFFSNLVSTRNRHVEKNGFLKLETLLPLSITINNTSRLKFQDIISRLLL